MWTSLKRCRDSFVGDNWEGRLVEKVFCPSDNRDRTKGRDFAGEKWFLFCNEDALIHDVTWEILLDSCRGKGELPDVLPGDGAPRVCNYPKTALRRFLSEYGDIILTEQSSSFGLGCKWFRKTNSSLPLKKEELYSEPCVLLITKPALNALLWVKWIY